MRKITVFQMMVFGLLSLLIVSSGVTTTFFTVGRLYSGYFKGILILCTGIANIYVYAFCFYRLFLYLFPLPTGEIPAGSRAEFIYHIHILFFLVFFYLLTRSAFLPIPLLKVVYMALGIKIGKNSFITGIIFDPVLVTIGNDTLIGEGAIIVPHIIENKKLAHYQIKIGSNVTIGTRSVILTDVTIEDHAIVAAGAVVTKGTHISKGECWGGVPAKRLKGRRGWDENMTAHTCQKPVNPEKIMAAA